MQTTFQISLSKLKVPDCRACVQTKVIALNIQGMRADITLPFTLSRPECLIFFVTMSINLAQKLLQFYYFL